MNEKIPLGMKEDLHLEFKSRDSLNDHSSIAREVTGMLNAVGGKVWIGLEDRDGYAVSIQNITDPDLEMRRLIDALVDRIEPSPLPEEVVVDIVQDEKKQVILMITVKPKDERKPYAMLKGGGRHFVVRIEDRLRPMSREEILKDGDQSSEELREVKEDFLREREEHQRKGKSSFWLRIQPVADLTIDIQQPEIAAYLQDPILTGNRREGWNFASTSIQPKWRTDRIISEVKDVYSVEVFNDGTLKWCERLDNFSVESEKELFPLSFLESVISFFRFASILYKNLNLLDKCVVADLAFIQAKGWKLRPYSRGTIGYETATPEPLEEEDLVFQKPMEFRNQELMELPDKCGFRLVRKVYEAFGHSEDKIPRHYNRDAGRLILPE
jgi:hypothetical protein